MATSIFDFPTTGVLAGLQLVEQLNSAFAAAITNNAGASPPADPLLYQTWYDPTTNALNVFNGSGFAPITANTVFSGVQLISGATTIGQEQLSFVMEAQGQASYTVGLPSPSSFIGATVAVFSNINAASPVNLSTATGAFLGAGFSGATGVLPYQSFGLFVSDGYNWLVFSNAGYALLEGSSAQTFNVGTASAPNNAIPLSQGQAIFAGVNGNSTEPFAVADASAPQDALNLGQASDLFLTSAGNNTFTGANTFTGEVALENTLAVPTSVGEITGGAMPSGASLAWLQASFPANYAGLVQSFYNNGAQVYSLDANGNIIAGKASLATVTANTLSVSNTLTADSGAFAALNGESITGIFNGTLGDSVVLPSGASNNTFASISVSSQAEIGNLTVTGSTTLGITSVSAGTGGTDALNYTQVNDGDGSLLGYNQGGAGAVERTVQAKLQESVSVLDFGADPTGANDSTTAFTDALTAYPNIFIPDGNYLLDNLAIPASCMSIIGQSEGSVTLTPSSSVTSGNFISYIGPNPIVVKGFTIATTASGVTPLIVQNANYPKVSNIIITQSTGSAHSLIMDTCTYGDVSKCTILNPGANGIQCLNSTGCMIHDNAVLSPESIMHCIQVYGGENNTVYGNYCIRTSSSPGFCISLWGTTASQAVGNNLVPNSLEGVNLAHSSSCLVSANLINCASGHHDFGMSIYADTANCTNNKVTGNTVTNCGKAGVAFASSADYYCESSMASDNLIINPCQNQLSGEPHAALYVYGNSSATLITIQNNYVDDGLSEVNYICLESAGTNNIYKDNVFQSNAVITENLLEGSGSVAWDTVLATYDASVSAQAGSISSASATVSYRRRGLVADVVMNINVSDSGSGAIGLVVSMPFPCAYNTIAGRNITQGNTVVGTGSGSDGVTFYSYNNDFPGTSEFEIVASGIMSIQT